MTEKLCPYCKGAGFQMLATRAATPHDKDKGLLIEERLGGRVVIEPVHCWKCRGTGKMSEMSL